MSERYIRVVSLWIHPGQAAAFEAFERDASRIMARHGGRIDAAIRLTDGDSAGDESPYELHIVSFPDQESADSYRADPETEGLAERRARIIAKTVIKAGRMAGPY
jgi:antibiotic biosynthesis monooxygenase (ABM) superfamily enzyme